MFAAKREAVIEFTQKNLGEGHMLARFMSIEHPDFPIRKDFVRYEVARITRFK